MIMKIKNFITPLLAFLCCSCEQQAEEVKKTENQEKTSPFANFDASKTAEYLRDLEKVRSLRTFISNMKFETFKQEYYIKSTYNDFDVMEHVLQKSIGEELYKQMNDNLKKQKGFKPYEDVMPQPKDLAIKEPSVGIK